jgi:hypothetical protein
MVDSYTNMMSKGMTWSPETTKATKPVGSIPGRTVRLHKSQTSQIFGSTVEGGNGDSTSCRANDIVADDVVCEGSTTPQPDSKALFEIRCGDSMVSVTDDPYHFSPEGPPHRSYVCDQGLASDDNNIRPVWTLLGYFASDACQDIESGYRYDSDYC